MLECEDSDSDNQDTDNKIFLGTLIVEQCPDNCVDLNQVNTLSTQKNNKVLIQTHLTAKPYHKHTTPVVCKGDTGAEVNVMSERDYESTIPNPKQRKLKSPSVKITAYCGYEIKNIGTCQLYMHHRGDVKPVIFNVTDVEGPAMLGCETSRDLGHVQFNSGIMHVHQHLSSSSATQSNAHLVVSASGSKYQSTPSEDISFLTSLNARSCSGPQDRRRPVQLTIEDGIILKRERILVPPPLSEETLKTIHKGHLGQEKFLLRARSAVFWPGITKDIVNLVAGCDACQKHQRTL